jgi:hypothetical protein
MDAFLILPWRPFPAAFLMVLGLIVTVVGVLRQGADLRRPVTDPVLALALARALRVIILGLAATVFGAAWLWQIAPLALFALVVAGEETLEISVVVAALRTAPGMARSRRS